MSLVKAVRSHIFFLSVTALMCFVLDHLLCPERGAAVVTNDRRWHFRQTTGLVVGDKVLHQDTRAEYASRAGAAGAVRIGEKSRSRGRWREGEASWEWAPGKWKATYCTSYLELRLEP